MGKLVLNRYGNREGGGGDMGLVIHINSGTRTPWTGILQALISNIIHSTSNHIYYLITPHPTYTHHSHSVTPPPPPPLHPNYAHPHNLPMCVEYFVVSSCTRHMCPLGGQNLEPWTTQYSPWPGHARCTTRVVLQTSITTHVFCILLSARTSAVIVFFPDKWQFVSYMCTPVQSTTPFPG